VTEKLNKVLEENVWLQSELEEQNSRNQELIQRLKEEIRDLKVELTVADRYATVKPSPESPVKPSPRNGSATTSPGGSINLVNDMLGLVKDMEKRLLASKAAKNVNTPPGTPVQNGKIPMKQPQPIQIQ